VEAPLVNEWAVPRGAAWRVRWSTKWAPRTGVIVAGPRAMTAIVVDTSTHTSAVRIGVVRVKADAAGVRMVEPPSLCWREAAVQKRLADTTTHRRGPGRAAGLGVPKRAGLWGGAPVNSAILSVNITAGGPGAGRVAGWSVPLRRSVERGGGLRGAVVTRPCAGARRRGRGGSVTVAISLRSASWCVVGALLKRHENGSRQRDGWEGRVGGRSRRDGRWRTRAK